jgi:rSAM/selenodomain-associated transferase 2
MVSIVVPAFNEEQAIGATLSSLLRLRPPCEIIVADGGSTDATCAIAARLNVPVVKTQKGRGIQLAAGAARCRGNVLWFVHADTLVPPQAAERMAAVLEDRQIIGGNFEVDFAGSGSGARFLTRLYPHLRLLGLRYGDSGIFVRREVYDRAGGFQPYPLFEDLDLLRRIRRFGRLACVPCRLRTSGRRFEGKSFPLMFARWTALQVGYWAGVSPHRLAAWYSSAAVDHTNHGGRERGIRTGT